MGLSMQCRIVCSEKGSSSMLIVIMMFSSLLVISKLHLKQAQDQSDYKQIQEINKSVKKLKDASCDFTF